MAVLAHEHEAQPQDDLALAVGRDRPPADLVADLDVGHVADPDRHAVLGRHHDGLDLLDVDGAADAVDQEHAAAPADVAAADVAVVLLDRLDHLVEGQAVLDEAVGVDADLVLLLVAAPAVDLGRALHCPQLGPDDPVVDGAQLGDVVPLAGDDVVEDLAQAGGHRPHLGPRDALGDVHRGQPLVDELAGEVDVGAVLEGHHHLGQAELGHRAQLLQAGQAADAPARWER